MSGKFSSRLRSVRSSSFFCQRSMRPGGGGRLSLDHHRRQIAKVGAAGSGNAMIARRLAASASRSRGSCEASGMMPPLRDARMSIAATKACGLLLLKRGSIEPRCALLQRHGRPMRDAGRLEDDQLARGERLADLHRIGLDRIAAGSA